MKRFAFLTTACLVAAALLLAVPVDAKIIPAGSDRWVTPNDGGTFFEFPPGDVESLCGLPATAGWNRQVRLAGVSVPGADWDTSIRRLQDADLSAAPEATVEIQLEHLQFRSIGIHGTPCGKVNWRVKSLDDQDITKMTIYRTSDVGGRFQADISVNAVFAALDAETGALVGQLYYKFELPENGATPFSFDPVTGGFRPGIDEDENCFDVLRDKIGTLPARHKYFIENLIAQGRCSKRQ